jgi:O-antigen ligase
MRGRIVLFSGVIFMLLSMAYTGTRTATAMIPAGIIMFGLLTITNKKTLVLLIISVMAYGILVYGPFYGSTARRLRSTFYPEHDASFNVRDYNRHRIQPYIYSHPIGGGLATVGVPGEEYSPHHPLAGFPPDNGYLATVLETGWIGLIIYLAEIFIILTLAVCNYYRAKDREIRNLYAGIIAFIFMWVVAQYGQSAIGRYTHNAIYTPVLALIVVLRYFDQKISSDKALAAKIKEEYKPEEDVNI